MRTLWGEARGKGLAGQIAVTKPIPAGQFAQAQIAADQVLAGRAPDPTGGATHYYATTMPKAPAWAAKAKQTLKLGRHLFFKDVP